MCDKCEGRVQHGLSALEALANGEDVPELPTTEGLPAGASPIPMIAIEMGDKVGILTSREGWDNLKALMKVAGGFFELGDTD